MTTELIEEAARRFALLGDPTRLTILHTLLDRGELSVGELAEATETSRFNVSAHLARLAKGGLLGLRKAGTTHYYSVADPGLRAVCDLVCASIRQRAEALAGPG